MPLFGNKKKLREPLRTLSEKEIQNKLYGHLRPEGALSQGVDPTVATLKYRAGATTKIASPSAPPLNVSSRQTSFSSEQIPLKQDSKASDGIPLSRNSTVLPSSPAVLDKNSNSQQRVSQWLEQENETTERKWGAEFSPPRKDRGAKGPLVILNERFFSAFLSAVLFFIRICGGFIRILWRAFIAIIFSLDLRKPGVRRAAYWLTALGLLAGVFLGIHLLNVKREVAMKTASRQSKYAATAVQKPKVYQPIFPSLTVLPIAESQSSKEQESKSQKSDLTALSKENEIKNQGEVKEKKAETPAARELPKAVTPEALLQPTRPEFEEAASQKGVVIQVATFAVQEDAERLASRLKQASFRPFVRSFSRTGGRLYYCVFMGSFETYRKAQTVLAEFRKHEIAKSFKDAFVRSL